MGSIVTDSLVARLAEALPAGTVFHVHHVSAPPANCTALFSAPPNEEPESTECEPHFLSVSIEHEGKFVQVFAVEVLIYTTATLTTIFVSKADSTGYLHLANLPKTSASPIKSVISTFLEHFVETKRRQDARLVLSLFARAQDQYLFPGSIENKGKHVLDDRGLIRWWCKIFDSILQKYPTSAQLGEAAETTDTPLGRGYLVVPGCETYETKLFFPRPYDKNRWLPTDPLRLLGKSLTLPERCLIPRFPDDPKARFALDLDDELQENGPQPMNSPEKNPHPGKWRSVRSIEQFWELMAFRQECAAGRAVGFLWAVFENDELRRRPDETVLEDNALPTPDPSQVVVPHAAPTAPAQVSPKAPLSPIPSQIPLPESPTPLPVSVNDEQTQGTPKAPHRQPSPGPAESGSIRLPPPAYSSVIDLLMELDYDTLEACKESTNQFIEKVLEKANDGGDQAVKAFGLRIEGKKIVEVEATAGVTNEPSNDGVQVLNTGLIRKKKRPATDDVEPQTRTAETNGVNVLPTTLIRKKPKV